MRVLLESPVARFPVAEHEHLLHHIHAQHPSHTDRRAATATLRRIQPFDDRYERIPRHCRIELGQNPLAPRDFALPGELRFQKKLICFIEDVTIRNAVHVLSFMPARDIAFRSMNQRFPKVP